MTVVRMTSKASVFPALIHPCDLEGACSAPRDGMWSGPGRRFGCAVGRRLAIVFSRVFGALART